MREYPPFQSYIKVAVIDTGVKRNHEDLEGVFTEWGVDCFNGKYVSGINYGWYREADDKYYHGTAVSGIIGALTNNGEFPAMGVASCASGIRILPIYVDFEGNSVEKAIRALRFDYPLTGFGAKEPFVRVVNMSLSSKYEDQDLAEYDIGRDIEVEHRFYVASAGNYKEEYDDDCYGLYYPAAYADVMGVTGMYGLVFHENDDGDFMEELNQHPGTHYFNTYVYPVSAFFDFNYDPPEWSGQPKNYLHPSLWTTVLPNTSPPPYYTTYYDHFMGTSAAAPQVAALAARLFQQAGYMMPTEANRMLVWNRIVSTIREQREHIAGIVDYEAALEDWN